MKITMAHGSGGAATTKLISEIFAKKLSNPILDMMEDSAVVEGSARIAMTTDSFVVTPVSFAGGDIGRLCICGTVNDLLMRGAKPKYITCGFIIEEGMDTEVLASIVDSIAATAKEAGVMVVAGDTKVVEGNGGLYINTAGVGFIDAGVDVKSANCKPGDAIIVSGNLGDHHATILSARMNISNDICSDNAPLNEMVYGLLNSGLHIHAMRDITRGGLGTVLNEISEAAGFGMELEENRIPVSDGVRAFAKILGLDVMHMGNEGKMVVILPGSEAEKALDIIRNSAYGADAAIVGRVTDGLGVTMITGIGGRRPVTVLMGEGLPRIC